MVFMTEAREKIDLLIDSGLSKQASNVEKTYLWLSKFSESCLIDCIMHGVFLQSRLLEYAEVSYFNLADGIENSCHCALHTCNQIEMCRRGIIRVNINVSVIRGTRLHPNRSFREISVRKVLIASEVRI